MKRNDTFEVQSQEFRVMAGKEQVQNRNKGHLFVVSGPSGVGKTTIIERSLKEDRTSRFSISYTTRQKRKNVEY